MRKYILLLVDDAHALAAHVIAGDPSKDVRLTAESILIDEGCYLDGMMEKIRAAQSAFADGAGR